MDLFGFNIVKKSKGKELTVKEVPALNTISRALLDFDTSNILGRFNPYYSKNLFTLYKSIAEIQYPIRFITDKIKNAEFVVKRISDDAIVSDVYLNKILDKPNPFYSFNYYIAASVAMRLIDGNSYCYAMADEASAKYYYKYAKAFYVLPSQDITINVPFGATPYLYDSIENVIKSYDLFTSGKIMYLNPRTVLHQKDDINFGSSNDFKSYSRLEAQKYPISNLMAVYEARNVIYTKRGALGALVSAKTDASGVAALSPAEKKKVNETFNSDYGLSYDKSQYIISDVPVDYLQLGMSIKDLEPFEETLSDAISIGSAFQIDKELIPKKDNSTFANQENAEAAFYPNVLFPLLKEELRRQSTFMGLTNAGMYFDYVFDNVPVLEKSNQQRKEAEGKISNKCKIEFDSGIITLNDWRREINLPLMSESIYNKTLIQMSEGERGIILSLKSSKPTTTV